MFLDVYVYSVSDHNQGEPESILISKGNKREDERTLI